MVFLIEKTFSARFTTYYLTLQPSTQFHLHLGHINTIDHGDGDSLVSAHLKKHSTDQCLLVSIYHDSGIKHVSAFLRILGVAHVNSCQSLSKSCPRNDPGDDESTSCYMQCKNSLSPIQVHPMKLIRYLTNSAQSNSLAKRSHPYTYAPLRISYAIAISLALTRPPHFQLFLSLSPFLSYGIFFSCYLPVSFLSNFIFSLLTSILYLPLS